MRPTMYEALVSLLILFPFPPSFLHLLFSFFLEKKIFLLPIIYPFFFFYWRKFILQVHVLFRIQIQTTLYINFLKNKESNILFISKYSSLGWSHYSAIIFVWIKSITIKMSLFWNLLRRGKNWKDYGVWSHCRPRHLFREGKKC